MEEIELGIIGAGPSGLACGIEAVRSGVDYRIFEKGAVTDSIRRFPVNMTFFSTPELLEIGGIPFTCAGIRPTRVEVLKYYRRIAEVLELDLSLKTEINKIERQADGFVLWANDQPICRCGFLIVAIGYYDLPNRLGIEGEDLSHVKSYYDEPYEYAGHDVVVVGGSNSAVEAALELWRAGARVVLVHRGDALSSTIKYWVRPDIENRIKSGEITAYFNAVVSKIDHAGVSIEVADEPRSMTLPAQYVFSLIGYRPNPKLLVDAGVVIDSQTLVPQINADTFETNVENLFVAGSITCGCEIGNVFIENGRSHAVPILDTIATRIRLEMVD